MMYTPANDHMTCEERLKSTYIPRFVFDGWEWEQRRIGSLGAPHSLAAALLVQAKRDSLPEGAHVLCRGDQASGAESLGRREYH